jgi:hypothetical protein
VPLRLASNGDTMNATEVVVTYPPDLLSFAQSTPAGDWSVIASQNSPGQVVVDLSNTSSMEGNSLVGNLIFHTTAAGAGNIRHGAHVNRDKRYHKPRCADGDGRGSLPDSAVRLNIHTARERPPPERRRPRTRARPVLVDE